MTGCGSTRLGSPCYRKALARKASKPGSPQSPDPAWRIVLLQGKESFLRLEHTTRLVEALEAELGQVDRIRFDGAATPIADVLDECRSFGLMQQHKIIIVDDADQLVKEHSRPLMERYAANPCDQATLVLRASTWRKGKLDKLIDKVGGTVKCDVTTDALAMSWACKRCQKRHDAALDAQAARMLVDRLGPDLGRIDTELAKLAVWVGSAGTITRQDVARLVGMSRQEEVWGIQSALLEGKSQSVENALHQLNELLEVSRHSPVVISFACMDLARKLHGMCRARQSGMNPAQAAKVLKLWGPSRDPIINAARSLSPQQSARLLDLAVRADVRLKSGLGKPHRTVERLVLEFASSTG